MKYGFPGKCGEGQKHFQNTFRNPKRPRHKNRNKKSIKNLLQAMTNLKKTTVLLSIF